MILAGLTLPRSSGAFEINVPLSAHCVHSFFILDYSLRYYFALWFTLVVLSTIFVFIHGLDYVPWPRLLPLTYTIHYGGFGFRSGYHRTGFGIDLSKLKSSGNVQWVPKGIRLCLKLRLATRNIFIIFDSHPRTSYPNDAGMTVGPHLSMQAEIAELRLQKEFLKREQQRLESEIEEAEARSREQSQADPAAAAPTTATTATTIQIVFQKYFDHSFATPKQFSSLTRQSSTPSSSKASTSTLNPFSPDFRSAGPSSSRAPGYLSKPLTPDDSIFEAMRLQNEFDK